MTTNEQRMHIMRQRLTEALEPQTLDIQDESHLHVGHPGAKTGAGHFALAIISHHFADKTLLQSQRMIYAALGDMIPTDIHALRIISVTAEK